MSPPSFVILRFSALGDVVLATSVLQAVRDHHPDAHITFVTKAPYAPLMRAQPTVNEVVALHTGDSVNALARQLSRPFTDGIDLQSSLRSWALRKLVRTKWNGVTKPRLDRFRTIWLGQTVTTDHTTARYARAAGLTHAPDPMLVVPDSWATESPVPDRLIVLAPGAAHRSKRWPVDHWIELARHLRADDWAPVFTGTPEDRTAFAETGLPWVDSLEAAVAAITRARACVTNDSGLMHVAAAVNTPVIAMFGPTSPHLGFAPRSSRAVVMQEPLSCRPCSAFGGNDCPAGHHLCLASISPAEVAAEVEAAA